MAAETTATLSTSAKTTMDKDERRVIVGSSVGTIFEWYDFYIYGSLAAIMARQFFGGLDPTAAFIFALLAFAAGFIVRPLGAVVFGRLGDLIGRKYTFLITIVIMGLATFLIGLLPSYESIGIAAPAMLILLRLAQGLALGGEYGGAAIYVAEHAPQHRRGAYTAWIQTTATLGLFLSLLVILGIRTWLGEEAFADWGWRLPFLLSFVLLAVSLWIRLRMSESPAFVKMQEEGKLSKAPLSEVFGQLKNIKILALALFGLVAGQAVVWYTGQFYALFFMTTVLKVDAATANILLAVALLIGTPFFLIFGRVSDHIGRKPIIMLGLLMACLTYFPLFRALTEAANPDLARAQAKSQVVVKADPMTCSFQGSPIAREIDFTSACDIAKRALAGHAASYANQELTAGSGAIVSIGGRDIVAPNARLAEGRFDAESQAALTDFRKQIASALAEAGYPKSADPQKMNKPLMVLILTILVIYVTMVYGPIAAALVEMFPTRIRYTSLSIPYHIGNGWFGGLMPTIAFAMVAGNGDIYHGLWYPVVIAAVTLVIGMLFLRETKDVDIYSKFLYWHPNRLRK
jgi:MFS family permease